MEEFFSKKFMNKLFKAAGATVQYENQLVDALRF